MKLQVGEKYFGIVIEVCGIKNQFNASIQLNDRYQTEIELFDISKLDFDRINNADIKYVHAKINNYYISIFDLLVTEPRFTIFGNEQEKGWIKIIASYAIVGTNFILSDAAFSQLRFRITDGFELIGMCPYDVNDDYTALARWEKIEIPAKVKILNANTPEWKVSFYSIPSPNFSREGVSFGFDHWIDFRPKTAISLFDFRDTLHRITSFFSILSSESVTVNSLEIEGANDTGFNSYDVYGLCNYPKESLNLFNGNGHDSSAYLRLSLFKVTDFVDIGATLNIWFEKYEKLIMADDAYLRTLLDEDLNIVTVNKFLAAMQIVEGYIAVDEQNEIKKFDKQKKKLIGQLSNTEDKEFIKKFCSYTGETFRNKLMKYTYKALDLLKPLLNLEFDNKYANIIGEIKEERDIYTHSSSRKNPKIEFNRLMEISSIYKTFYRILVLSELGMSPEIIRKRLYTDNRFKEYLFNLFNIEIKSDTKLSEYDEMMWYFS